MYFIVADNKFLPFILLFPLAIFFLAPLFIDPLVSNRPHPRNVTLDYANFLNNNTLHVSGWGTGDPLNNEIDLFVGVGKFGALSIGSDAQISRLDGVGQIGDLNLSHVFLFSHDENPIVNNISFLFTSDNKLRLVIPVAGDSLATYNPRSQMIGGDLGQQYSNDVVVCPAQGYKYIDCKTDLTGADLGVQDDLEVRGNIYGSVPYGNMWFHNDMTNGNQTVISLEDTWTNVSGFSQVGGSDQILNGFTFTNGNALTPEFDGIYHVSYSLSYQKLTGSAVNHEFKTILTINGVIQYNTETHRTIKQNDAVASVGSTAIFNLTAGDIIYLQVQGVGNDVDIGSHAGTVVLTRIGN